MTTDFLYVKSQDKLINIRSIENIEFTNGDDDDEDNLTIQTADSTLIDVDGEEAEALYLELLKKLPNLITIGK